MIPLEDLRVDDVDAFYNDIEDYQNHPSPVPFAFWEDDCTSLAVEYEACQDPPPDQCVVGQTTGTGYQISLFYPGGIQFSGATSAGWSGPPSGTFGVSSYSGFKFRVDTAFDYDLFSDYNQGDTPAMTGSTGGAVRLWVYNSTSATMIYENFAGPGHISGRLGPGIYKLDGLSVAHGQWESFQGSAYSAQWTIAPPPQPHIAFQPSDRSIGCGGTATFSVGTTGSQSNYTFQWRRNFAPLTNGSGVSGATTSSLTLSNACSAGDYDVVVTGPNPIGGGTIAEPSRLAHLSIVTATGVETEPTDPAVTVIRSPAPNPFRASTTIAYDVHKETRLVADVYNASGVRIRSLADRSVSGSGTVTWDGCLTSGARAPAGIYFLRVDLGRVRETRKAVLLE